MRKTDSRPTNSEVNEMSLEGIVALGYCTDRNKHKELDADLLQDICTAIRAAGYIHESENGRCKPMTKIEHLQPTETDLKEIIAAINQCITEINRHGRKCTNLNCDNGKVITNEVTKDGRFVLAPCPECGVWKLR